MFNRPKQYEPEDVTKVGLYCLHSNLTYFDSFKKACKTSNDIVGYKFRRQDGQVFNYFQVLQDVDDEHVPREERKGRKYPTLDEFIDGYKQMLEDGIIQKGEINIAPLVQVQYQRAHFNTLVIYSDENNVTHAYIIEPRSTDYMPNKLKDYGIDKLASHIESKFDEDKINAQAIKVGKQSIADDKTCGAHQINFTEIMTMLPTDVFTHPANLQQHLAHTHVTRRRNDNALIHLITTSFADFKANKTPAANSAASASSSVKKIESDIDSDNDLETFTTIDDIDEKLIIYLHNKEFQSALSKRFADRRNLTISDLLITSIDEIEKGYLNKHQSKLFNFFSGHTRQDAAQLIKDALEFIHKNPNIADDRKLLDAVILLFANFNAIKDTKSDLRLCLGGALARLLDCEYEYQTQLVNSSAITLRSNFETLFNDHLEFKLAHLNNTDVQLLIGKLKTITQKMIAIDNIDASFIHKIGSKDKENLQRNNLIDEIKKEIGMIPMANANVLK